MTLLRLQFEFKVIISYMVLFFVEIFGVYSFSGPMIKIGAALLLASILTILSEEKGIITPKDSRVVLEKCTTDMLNDSNQIIFSANGVETVNEVDK